MKTISQAVARQREIELPCGERVTVRRLRVPDWDRHIYAYSLLLTDLALPPAGETLTQEHVTDHLAEVAMGLYAEERNDARLVSVEWLQLFVPDIGVELLDELQPEDWQAIIAAMMEDNPVPFALANPKVRQAQLLTMKQLIDITSADTSSSSDALVSTPSTPN